MLFVLYVCHFEGHGHCMGPFVNSVDDTSYQWNNAGFRFGCRDVTQSCTMGQLVAIHLRSLPQASSHFREQTECHEPQFVSSSHNAHHLSCSFTTVCSLLEHTCSPKNGVYCLCFVRCCCPAGAAELPSNDSSDLSAD